LALPKGHKYRAVASRSFRPRYAPNDEQWERAVPLLVEILAHDPRQLAANDRSLQIHRSALASHLYWLAGDYPDQLTADFALDERQVSQSAARSEGYLTRRSRHAYMSKLRYFRRGYPKLFPAKDPIPPANHFGPVTDVEFDIGHGAEVICWWYGVLRWEELGIAPAEVAKLGHVGVSRPTGEVAFRAGCRLAHLPFVKSKVRGELIWVIAGKPVEVRGQSGAVNLERAIIGRELPWIVGQNLHQQGNGALPLLVVRGIPGAEGPTRHRSVLVPFRQRQEAIPGCAEASLG